VIARSRNRREHQSTSSGAPKRLARIWIATRGIHYAPDWRPAAPPSMNQTEHRYIRAATCSPKGMRPVWRGCDTATCPGPYSQFFLCQPGFNLIPPEQLTEAESVGLARRVGALNQFPAVSAEQKWVATTLRSRPSVWQVHGAQASRWIVWWPWSSPLTWADVTIGCSRPAGACIRRCPGAVSTVARARRAAAPTSGCRHAPGRAWPADHPAPVAGLC
jgi:hypothetical protein